MQKITQSHPVSIASVYQYFNLNIHKESKENLIIIW